jgi:hypothetical protein
LVYFKPGDNGPDGQLGASGNDGIDGDDGIQYTQGEAGGKGMFNLMGIIIDLF